MRGVSCSRAMVPARVRPAFGHIHTNWVVVRAVFHNNHIFHLYACTYLWVQTQRHTGPTWCDAHYSTRVAVVFSQFHEKWQLCFRNSASTESTKVEACKFSGSCFLLLQNRVMQDNTWTVAFDVSRAPRTRTRTRIRLTRAEAALPTHPRCRTAP